MDRRKTLRPAVILLVAEVVMVISDVMLAVVPLVNACSKSNRLIAECRLCCPVAGANLYSLLALLGVYSIPIQNAI